MGKRLINIAVVGGSPMARIHVASINDCKGARLYALCDNAPEILEDLRSNFHADVYTSDYRTLVNDENIDAVVLVVPDQLHLEMTEAFLRAGKAVLCEKPMALFREECVKMMKIEKETNGKLMIGQICRHTPGFIKAKELVDEGAIGELVFVESEYAHNYKNARGYNDWRVVPERNIFIGGGCHAVDLLRWICGNPTEVYAHANHKIMVDWPTDDTVIALFKFPDNVPAKVFCSSGAKRNYTMRTVLYGTKGTIITDNTSRTMQLFTEDKKYGDGDFKKGIEIPIDVRNHNTDGEIESFVDALVNDKPMPISSYEGAATVFACLAAVESTRTGKPVDIVYPAVC